MAINNRMHATSLCETQAVIFHKKREQTEAVN
jgi:hypothetical protein